MGSISPLGLGFRVQGLGFEGGVILIITLSLRMMKSFIKSLGTLSRFWRF